MTSIIEDSKVYYLNLIKVSYADLPYHNYLHALEVYEDAYIIGKYESINERKLEPMLIASFFKNIGYFYSDKNHVKHSIDHAVKFLSEQNYPEEKIAMVIDCIKAVETPQEPNNLMQCIICDASLYYLGSDEFFEKNGLLRQELEIYRNIFYQDEEWNTLSLNFLPRHEFKTTFGQDILQPTKKKNIQLLLTYNMRKC